MIPKDAREVYVDEKGNPIAYCFKESIGLTDLHRGQFFEVGKERVYQLLERAKSKEEPSVVICIDVDDKTWTFVVDHLMPGHDWQFYRDQGQVPIARGVVPRVVVVDLIEKFYPAALPVPESSFIAVLAAGGISCFT